MTISIRHAQNKLRKQHRKTLHTKTSELTTSTCNHTYMFKLVHKYFIQIGKKIQLLLKNSPIAMISYSFEFQKNAWQIED